MNQTNKAVINWLYFCASAVLIMMLIGALTRLTESGLSIAVWEPFKGILPPLSHSEWVRYFEIYKTTPEFKMVNNWMKLENFQGIFWLEYIHRLWGRIIGLVFLLPLIYFYARKIIDGKLTLKLLGIFCLIGLQGFVGWFMVHSGLQESFSVSHYRLAAHLLIAVLIYSLLIWTAFNLQNPMLPVKNGMTKFAKIIIFMIVIMLILGAFVAGKDAGFAYNTFPLMDGKIIPHGLYKKDPWWINHFENGLMLQFQHRVFAYIITMVVLVFAVVLVRKNIKNIGMATGLVAVLSLQVALGISTLISFGTYADYSSDFAYHKIMHLPVLLAALHQFGAVILLTVMLKALHKLARNEN